MKGEGKETEKAEHTETDKATPETTAQENAASFQTSCVLNCPPQTCNHIT